MRRLSVIGAVALLVLAADASAIGQPDTFCGGLPRCWNTFDVLYGDVSIYGTP